MNYWKHVRDAMHTVLWGVLGISREPGPNECFTFRSRLAAKQDRALSGLFELCWGFCYCRDCTKSSYPVPGALPCFCMGDLVLSWLLLRKECSFSSLHLVDEETESRSRCAISVSLLLLLTTRITQTEALGTPSISSGGHPKGAC